MRVKVADHFIVEPNKRTEMNALANEFYVRRTLEMLLKNPGKGTKFTAVVSLLWQLRRNLYGVELRLLALLLMPGSAVRWIRRVKQIVRVNLRIRHRIDSKPNP